MKKIAVFVSGSGSNFQAIIDAINKGEINGEIVACISSSETAYANQRAKDNAIPVFVFNRKEYNNLDNMFIEIAKTLDSLQTELIVLAGYMTVVPSSFVSRFAGKIINIHPSLIPLYSGVGYYGMRVHEAVLAGGEKESGATVHYVDEGVDTGKIIAQETVPVYSDDTAETLAKRVLTLEHTLFVKVIKNLCN